MIEIREFMQGSVGPFTWNQLAAALGLIVAAFIIRAIVNNWISRRLIDFARRTRTRSDDVAARALVTPLGWVLPVVGVYLALRVLATDYPDVIDLAAKVFTLAMTVVITWTVFKFIDAWAILATERAEDTNSSIDNTLVPTLRKAIKTFVVVVVFVVVVQNLGYSVSGLLGG